MQRCASFYRYSLEGNTESVSLEDPERPAKKIPVMKKPTARTFVQHGFSLVELLVVIAVIAVIAAIAIPNIANITGAATEAKHQRNAQNIANLAAAARAAGNTNAYGTISAWVTDLTSSNGITGEGSSALRQTVFRMDALTGEDVTDVQEYLDIENASEDAGAKSSLIYKPKTN